MEVLWMIGVVIIIVLLKDQYNKKVIEREENARREKFCQQREELLRKYDQNAEVVDKILAKTIWQGETVEQLKDSLGEPLDIDSKVYKNKSKHIWKYFRQGSNRYGLRVTIEDNIIVGWEEKI